MTGKQIFLFQFLNEDGAFHGYTIMLQIRPMLKLLATEWQSHKHPRVLSILVGEIFLWPISINSPTHSAHRGINENLTLCLLKNDNFRQPNWHNLSIYLKYEWQCQINMYFLKSCRKEEAWPLFYPFYFQRSRIPIKSHWDILLYSLWSCPAFCWTFGSLQGHWCSKTWQFRRNERQTVQVKILYW